MSHVIATRPLLRSPRSLATLVFAGALTLSGCTTADPPQTLTDDEPGASAPETVSASESTSSATESTAPGTESASAAPGSAPAAAARITGDSATGPGRSTAGAVRPMGSPGTAVESRAPGHSELVEVTGVRLATHNGFDRVVFDMTETGTPGWHTDYTETPVKPGSGFPIEFAGTVALNVNVPGATQAADIGNTPGAGGAVTEVISTFSHHGQAHFVVGLPERLPYSVQVLEGPKRLVIDILHG